MSEEEAALANEGESASVEEPASAAEAGDGEAEAVEETTPDASTEQQEPESLEEPEQKADEITNPVPEDSPAEPENTEPETENNLEAITEPGSEPATTESEDANKDAEPAADNTENLEITTINSDDTQEDTATAEPTPDAVPETEESVAETPATEVSAEAPVTETPPAESAETNTEANVIETQTEAEPAAEDPTAEGEQLKSDSLLEDTVPGEPNGVFITVKVPIGLTNEIKLVKVEVVSYLQKKPFLGGFKHRLTGVEYHNASAQTYAKKIIPSGVEKNERDTQTVIARNQIQMTYNDTSTQMTKAGCYVSNIPDKIIIPGKYFTAAEKEALVLEKVIILQSYWRVWLARRYVNKLRNDRNLRIEWERVQTEMKENDRAERIRREFERRMKPKTKEDFDLLYAALEKWRKEEVESINEKRSGPERKAALIGLLRQEEYLIQSIERHRINANTTNSKDNDRAFLDKAAAPKKWRAYDGKMTEMDTPHSLRAQQLRDLYNSLEMSYLTQDERLDVLLTLKYTIKEHECKLTQELMELIDREADLLTRGIKVSNLEGLRQRILCLFLQYCKTPLFNPEVTRLLKVPQDPSVLRKDIYFCPSCNAYLPASSFPIASNSRIVGRCKKCSKIDNDARLRNDFTKIRSMMRNLRRTEEGYDDGSKIAFTIQYADLQYLVENIWNAQSSLSGEDDLAELVLVRWNPHEHWSPWNCVLFTKEEASAHMRLDNVNEAYGRIFIGKVHHRHVLAKNYFSKLIKITDNMAREEKAKDAKGKSKTKPASAKSAASSARSSKSSSARKVVTTVDDIEMPSISGQGVAQMIPITAE